MSEYPLEEKINKSKIIKYCINCYGPETFYILLENIFEVGDKVDFCMLKLGDCGEDSTMRLIEMFCWPLGFSVLSVTLMMAGLQGSCW